VQEPGEAGVLLVQMAGWMNVAVPGNIRFIGKTQMQSLFVTLCNFLAHKPSEADKVLAQT
jgi:hypothetical protein